MAKITEEMKKQWAIDAEQKKQADLARIAELMEKPHIDEDGYPTQDALAIVEMWHWSDSKGWFDFINSIWHLKSWGWGEGVEAAENELDTPTYVYHISTAGWSGNEAIIRSMERNDFMWHTTWVQSRRGGHYIFEDRRYA